MMDAAQMITMLRAQTKTTVPMISDAVLATYLDISHKKIYKKIVNLDKNYFWQRWTSNVVANQQEYTLLTSSGTTFGQGSIEKIGIKYDDTDNFRDVEIKTWDELTSDASWYEENQDPNFPFVIISDKSIFIFPTPDKNVAGGLKMEGSRKPFTINETSNTDAFLCPVDYHHIIVLGAIPFVLNERLLEGESNNAMNVFDKELSEMLFDISSRDTSVSRGEPADLSGLE